MSTGQGNGLDGTGTANPAARAGDSCRTATEIWAILFFLAGYPLGGRKNGLNAGAWRLPCAEYRGDLFRLWQSTHGGESCRD